MSVKNQLAAKTNGDLTQKEQPKNMKQWIQSMEGEIAKALPSVITPERFTRMALTAISSNAQLAASTPKSFLGAMMNAAQLGLEPNTPLGQAYLIPFKNNKAGTIETQFQIGYKGLIDLAHRSGEFKTIYAKEVFENDDFSYEFGLEPKLTHKPAITGDRGKVTHYYAVFTLVNGGFGFDIMSVADVKKHAQTYSQAYNRGPWQTNFNEMAKKTVLKKVLKYAPIKTDFARQVGQDSTIKTDIKADMTEVESRDDIIEATYQYEEQNSDPSMDIDDSDSPDFVLEAERLERESKA